MAAATYRKYELIDRAFIDPRIFALPIRAIGMFSRPTARRSTQPFLLAQLLTFLACNLPVTISRDTTPPSIRTAGKTRGAKSRKDATRATTPPPPRQGWLAGTTTVLNSRASMSTNGAMSSRATTPAAAVLYRKAIAAVRPRVTPTYKAMPTGRVSIGCFEPIERTTRLAGKSHSQADISFFLESTRAQARAPKPRAG